MSVPTTTVRSLNKPGTVVVLLFLLSISAGTSLAQNRVRVTAPNGGENLTAGSTATISWSGAIYKQDSVRLEFSADDGASWTTIRSQVKGPQFEWMVPYVSSTRCRVRVTQVTGQWLTFDSVRSLSTPQIRGGAFVFSEDGSLVVRWGDKIVDIFDVQSGQLVRTFTFDTVVKAKPVLDRSNRYLAYFTSVGTAKRIEIWDITTGERVTRFESYRPAEYVGGTDDVYTMTFSDDSKRILVLGRFASAMWNVETGTMIDTLNSFSNGGVEHLQGRFSPDGSVIYIYTNRKNIEVWDASTLRYVRTVASDIFSGLISPDGKRFYSKMPEVITGYELEPFRKVFTYSASGPFETVVSGDGRYIVHREFGDSMIHVHSLPQDETIVAHIFSPATSKALGFSINAAGDRIATMMARDSRIVIWRFDNTDSSDAAFTITNTRTVLPIADLGETIRKRTYDTTLRSYITNSSAAPMQITSVSVTEGDTADFAVTAGNGPVTIPPGGSHDIGIRFRPSERGARSAWIEVLTSTGDMVGQVSGFARQGRIRVENAAIDFDTVQKGAYVDRDQTTFRNVGDAPIRIDSIVKGGRSAHMFTLLEGGDAPVELAPDEAIRLRIRFSPVEFGRITGGLGIYDEYQFAHPVDFFAFCQGVAAAPEEPIVPGIADGAAGFALHPNPAADRVTISCELSESAELRVRLVDVMGQMVLERDFGRVDSGLQNIHFDLTGLPSSSYWLIVSSNGKQTVRPVVVQH